MFEHCKPEQLTFPIWLLADSLPERWTNKIREPLDNRFPTRHNIWTPVWDAIQATVYLPDKRRVSGSRLCICNAAPTQANGKPDWDFDGVGIQAQIDAYATLLEQYRPTIVLAFGRRAFEFGRRAIHEAPQREAYSWTCKELGEKFRTRIADFDTSKTNLFPLLHLVIARGHWDAAHHLFTGDSDGDYFLATGSALGFLIKTQLAGYDIWE